MQQSKWVKQILRGKKPFKVILIPLIAFISFFQNYPALGDDPIEYKLAVIDAGGYVSKDDISVARFRSLLEQLDSKFNENQTEIADMTVKTQEILRGKGISEKMLNIMEGMNRLFPTRFPNQKYAEYLASYLVLRDSGQTHREAIEGLEALLETLGAR